MGTPQTNRPSFFKVMVGDFTKKLRIPVNFIENFNGIVPVESILRSPSGECWSINVKKVEENLFFREGWPDFVRDNSLEFGDFLVMKYIGNAQFDVIMYGTNGCEKELPLTNEDKTKVTKLISLEKKEKRQTKSNFTYLDNERTGAADASSSFKRKRPFFISTWMKKKKYQLELPKTFVRKVGNELSDFVVLKDAGCRLWSIGLRKAEGRVWFEKGWQEFTTHHSITNQHILRFNYDGNSFFYVFIVNTNAAEMEHLNGSGHKEETNKACQLPEMEEKGEEDEVLVLAAPPFRFLTDVRTEIIDGNADQTMKSKEEPTLARNQLQACGQCKEKNKNESRKEIIDGNANQMKKRQEQPTLARNPVQVCERFKEKNKIDSRKKIIEGNADSTTKSKKQPTLARNPLQVCEQSKEKNINEPRKKKIIDGSADQMTKSKDQTTSARNPLQLCEQSKEKNKNQSTYKRRDRSMSPSKRPYKKTRIEDGRKKRDIFDLDESNRIKQRSGSLTADFNGGTSIRCHNPIKISQNKTNVVKEIPITKKDKAKSSVPSGQDVGMQLNAGEHMKSTSAVARRDQSSGKVSSPSRGNEKTPPKSVVKREEDSDSSEPPTAKKSSHSLKTPGNEWANQVANAFKSKYPFFTVVLRDSYLSRGYLHIPNSFAKEYMTKSKSITLRGSDKQKWTVEYVVRGYATQLASGWTNFTREVNLEEEDVCVFELIEKKHTEMKISIFRKIKDKLTEVWPVKENAS